MIKSWSKLQFIVGAIFLLFTFSCKSSKKSKKTKLDEAMSIEQLNLALDDAMFSPEWFKASAQIKVDNDSKKIGFSANIKAEKDEQFWMNVKKLGFEGARLLCTSDSLMFLDRIRKEYFKGNINELATQFELPADIVEQLTLSNLQNIFVGNTLQDIIPYTELNFLESHYLLSGEKDGVKSALKLNKSNLLPVKSEFTQGELSVNISYLNYQALGERPFSYDRKILISNGSKTIGLDIEYSDVELNVPQKIIFSIPSRYTEMKI